MGVYVQARRYWNLVQNVKNWEHFLAFKFAGASHENEGAQVLKFQTRTGINIEVPRNVLSEFKEIFMSEAYLRLFPETPYPIRNVLDIGANVGFFSLFASHKFPNVHVFAIEPMPGNFDWLTKHQSLNPQLNWTCFQKAVGGTEGTAQLSYQSTNGLTTNASFDLNQELDSQSVTVDVTTLSRLIDDMDVDSVDLLKMDCEGAEFDILYETPASYLNRINNITMEVHYRDDEPANVQSVAAFLQQHGFETDFVGDRPLALLSAWR